MSPTVCVVMSTFNGAPYLHGQIESIRSQAQVTHVFIRDDGSQDSTASILETAKESDPRFHVQYGQNLGVNLSFSQALVSSPICDWYAFCDQDDWWPSTRTRDFLDFANHVDTRTPQLVVCQFVATQSGESSLLNTTGTSSALLLGLLKDHIDWKKILLAGNPLYGCCFFFNHALREIAQLVPAGKTTHDYWFALNAAYCGHLKIAPFAGTMYRQHASNASLGAPKTRSLQKLFTLLDSVRRDIVARKDMYVLVDELIRRRSGALAVQDMRLLTMARHAYQSGGISLFLFQVQTCAWRPKITTNVVRLASCLAESLGLLRAKRK
jgi:glycosyltransferase involved in cell wall biosynthesis